ncbi:hypothetical protein Tco_0064118 [Tanacetum coccineum]
MQATDLSKQETNSRLTNEFDKFTSVAGKSLDACESSQAKRVTTTHDPLALVAHAYAGSSHSHLRPIQEYYVTHPLSMNEFDDTQSYDIHGEVTSDDQIDKLTTSMMLLAQAITQHY